MNMFESVSTVFRKYATFSGRAPRSEFWWYQLFYLIIVGVPLAFISETLDNLWSLLNFIPALAVSCRRLHDIDKSGWWQLLPMVVLPLFMLGFALRGFDLVDYTSGLFGSPIAWAGIVIGIGLYILLIVWFARQGTPGPNRFGQDPFGRTDASVFE